MPVPGQNPLGKRFDDGEGRWLTVVGVVGSIRGTVFLVRYRTEMEDLAGRLRRAIWDVDSAQPVPEIATLEGMVSESVSLSRFRAVPPGCFAAIALILAIAGIYGVVEQRVSQRRHEFGIRMAMGARVSDVLRMVIRQGAALAGIGVALGLLAAFGVARLLSSVFNAANRDVSQAGPSNASASTGHALWCERDRPVRNRLRRRRATRGRRPGGQPHPRSPRREGGPDGDTQRGMNEGRDR
ncbi:MAG: FtsX-like permease family protein [Gemmatimonadota bacterium]